MKRCPECRRDYYDDSLLYCLDDGSALLEGPAASESATAILGKRGEISGHTQPQIHTTERATDTPAILQSPAQPIRARKYLLPILIGLAVVLGLAGSSAWYFWKGRTPSPSPAGKMKVTRLTSHGQVGIPAISPDGKYVIYTLWDAGKGSLWLRQVSTNSAVPLLQPPTEDIGYGGRAFSPNGEMVYYVYYDKENERGVLHEMPTLGGTPRKVLSDIQSGITFAPDGKSFAFLRVDSKEGTSQLMVSKLDGSDQRVVASRKGSEWFAGDPAWSPDGKTIACGTGTEIGGYSVTVAAYPVEGGEARPITEHKWSGSMTQVAWLGDGSGLLAAAGEGIEAPSQIWHISYPEGVVRQVTNDLNGYNYVSVTADSSALVTRQEDATTRIWTHSQGAAKQISNGKYDGAYGLAWTPDGKIVFTARNGESTDLAIINADGSQTKLLNSDASTEAEPCVTSDGRYVIFVSDRANRVPHIFRMLLDGSDLTQLTFGDNGQGQPRCSPDSRWVIFGTYVSGPRKQWKVAVEGGESTPISDRPLQDCFFLGESTRLFCLFTDEQSQVRKTRGAEVTLETGEFIRVFDIPARTRTHGVSPDGKSYVYPVSNGGTEDLWSQPLDGGPPKQLTSFKPESKMTNIGAQSWSRDGKQLAVARTVTTNDVVLIKDFR
ncbi:MAG: hypothetical protein ABIV48_01520 [Pyrinomonadaceae bacterium]